MPVLLSFASYSRWLDRYAPSFGPVLIDSGAYSEMTRGKRVSIEQYRDWSEAWIGRADAIAGLDDIRGDWRRSMNNYEAVPHGFPTFHDTDPDELLEDLVSMAKERCGWIGIGLKPPREKKCDWLREILSRIPTDLHVHGWALRRYTNLGRINSVDSTNWWRDGMKLANLPDLRHLTYGECLEIVIKRYVRWERAVEREQPTLFALKPDSGTPNHE